MKNVNQLLRTLLAGLCLALALLSSAQAQDRSTISLSVTDGSLIDCIKAIESQTPYRFIFNNDVNTSVPVSCQYRGENLEKVLTDLFGQNGIRWEISGMQILLTPPRPTEI